MAIDNYIVGDDYLDPLTALPTNYQRRSTKRSESQRDDEATFLNSTIHEIDSRQLSGSSHIVAQTNAPDNLNWISGLSRQKGLSGQLYDFEDFMYDDGANSPSQPQTWVYYIDGSGFAIHSASFTCQSTCRRGRPESN